MGRIVAVLRSEKKGVAKKEIAIGYLRKDYGLVGDAHAGSGRQVSLLALESIQRMQEKGLKVGPGDFAENLTTEGIDLLSLTKGQRILIGKRIVLKITQIGKECPAPCAIFRRLGECIMPKEGVFARVVKGGSVKAGDRLEVEE
ncbi:MOSC domain-containing protein [bacterium]|nr:MOSC domain-containing protein [bacterium]MBU4310046.1 MOSC domain-containing protein [bacterium]MBU4561111.1 MOSC domain-containing protein [bacterium]MCG2676439.1 MOSC domain-containing protein [bacterium]MCG2678312.1 MOSC domain-containing protein [bacterium]